MELISVLLIVIFILVSIYFYLSWNYNFWKKQGIPCAKGTIPILGNMAPVFFFLQSFNSLCGKFYTNNEYSMFGFYHLTTPSIVIREPKLIKEILVTNFANFPENQFQIPCKEKDSLLALHPFFSKVSEYWKINRAPMTNAFSGKKLKQMLGSFQEVASRMKEYLSQQIHLQNGQLEVELKKLFNRYTGDISADSIGIKGNYFEDQSTPNEWNHKTILNEIFNSNFYTGTLLQIICINIPRLGRMLNIALIPKNVESFFRNTVRTILAQRKLENKNYIDILQVISDFVQANPSPIDEESLITSNMLLYTAETYETSAHILSFTAFQLAMYPEIQEKARQEVKDVLEKYGGKLEYDALKEMVYLDQVLNESLRINNVVGLFVRVCCKETQLVGSDGLSCTIKPGHLAIIPVYELQMDPTYWPEPEKFDPGRFNQEQQTEWHKFTFLPFSEGPRNCVGKRISIMLIKLALVTILNNFALEVSSKTILPLKRNKSRFVSSYVNGLWVNLKPLNK